jgi:hypothetical protein
MNQQMRRAKLDFWGGVGIGSTIAFAGVVRAGSNNNMSSTEFFAHFVVGALVMGTGAFFAHSHAKRADEHLRLSVDVYNSRCYKPLPSDTARLAKGDAPVFPSQMKIYRDTTLYRELRNEPSHSGLFGLNVTPVSVNVASLNLNISGGIGFFYTYESKFGLNVNYQRAYLDDLTGDNRGDGPSGDADSHGSPANRTKSSFLDIQTKFTAVSWEKEGYYRLKLGNTRIGRMPAEVVGRAKGKYLKAITARLGYQADHRLVESSGGIAYNNATPVYNYNFEGQVYPLSPDNLVTSSSMIRSGIITAGIGWSSFYDLKIELLDDTYKGRREQKGQDDLFLDVLYAHSMTVEDMIYYHALEPRTGEYEHLPQRLDISRTPVKKIGARLGYQTIAMYSPHFGVRSQLEVGIRPGPQTLDNKTGFYFQATLGLIFGGRISHQ